MMEEQISPRVINTADGHAVQRLTMDRLPSLVRELLYYGVVDRVGPEQWELPPAIQLALEAQHLADRDGDRHLFVGLRCEQCRARTVTWMVGERRLCGTCSAPKPAVPEVGEADVARPAPEHWLKRRGTHRLRKAG